LEAKQIRQTFIDFFKDKDHKFIASSPLVPIDDQTLLFANAGMNQFKNIFLGLSTPAHPRAANSQKCLRVSGKHNDLEEVGADTYHHTFFEMLGNWSFGDYFKAEAIEWAWELLTKVYGLDESKLWATVFAGDKSDNSEMDTESFDLWPKVTSIPKERVLACSKKDNFWEMGATGPSGPCSEIHIDLGPDSCDMKHIKGHKCAVNAGCARFIELWNLVFIQYNRLENGVLEPLKSKHVDTGAGLERIAAVMQGKHSNYDTDLFMPIINATESLSGKKYTSDLDSKTDTAFRVIADHLRAVSFAITDGATPSNDGRGYVIRRILRRAARFGRVLNMHEPFLHKLVPTLVDLMGDAFGEIKQRADFITTVIESEEASFGRTLDRGIEIFNTAAKKAKKTKDKTITGDDAFQLYDTFGFPLDLTQLMAREQNLNVDISNFTELMEAQRARARASQKTAEMTINVGVRLPETNDSPKYETNELVTQIRGYIRSGGYITGGAIEVDLNETIGLVLNETCFYAEAGGQVGDCGVIKSGPDKFTVENTQKVADCIIHWGKLAGNMTCSQEVTATISKDRDATKKNHTATHLLQWALQKTVGDAIAQQGSLVTPEYLRFDFTSPKALTPEQIKTVENLVNEKIADAIPVTNTEMPIDQAKKIGAMALFTEKYGDTVRVVGIGADNDRAQAFSREFCGGTHLDNTAAIGAFKIVKEESISAGVRRITALTGQALNDYFTQRSDVIDELSQTLKAPADQLTERINKLLTDNKSLAKQLKSASKSAGTDSLAEAKKLLDSAEKINDSSIITGQISPAPAEQLRTAIDMLKKKAKSACIVLAAAENNKVTLLAGVTDDLIEKGLKAGDIIKQIAPIVEGGGGGRPQFAQAGGKNPEKINDALAKATEIIKATIEN